MWLATDLEGDYRNCECVLCCSNALQGEYQKAVQRIEASERANEAEVSQNTLIKKEGAGTKTLNVRDSKGSLTIKEGNSTVKGDKSLIRKEEHSGQRDGSLIKSAPMVVIPRRHVSSEGLAKSAPKPTIPKALSPTPLRRSLNSEQFHDTQERTFIFRLGEVVWFDRGNAFGLSVVLRRFMIKDQRNQSHARYEVQPLSHPFGHPLVVKIDQQSKLRPWLVFSPPPATNEGLRIHGLSYDRIDWKAVADHHYGYGDAEVDGSIFAARAVDASYTPIQPLNTSNIGPGETYYNGVYLGGEKIWIGDAVRLREGPDNAQKLMVLHGIIETLMPSSPTPIIHVVGDIYTFSTITIPPNSQIPANPHLPFRVQKDLEYRNRLSARAKNQICSWKLMEVKSRLGIYMIKGRWYEASVLLPILLDPTEFTKAVTAGDIPEIGHRLNARGTGTLTEGQQGNRNSDRLEAFGAAVPNATRISRDPQDEQNLNLDPQLTAGQAVGQVQQHQQHQQHSSAHRGVENDDAVVAQFMDLDRMEEGLDQQYIAHGGGRF